ncbi:MAG: PAS domain S-box-containing protein [Natronomonas sp.]|jgi:PAS domain S-box-containing protein|uniref:bacterio-opsin activator domain-containing protein n=1 Tax=Natronomonas sp. TaxID=2184060 RepID=UPI00398A1657
MSQQDTMSLTEQLLANVPDMIYVADSNGQLAWWNDRLREVTGYSDSELAGIDVFELLARKQREAAEAAFGNAGSFSPTETMEFDVITKDGERLPHEFNGGVIELEDETLIVGIGRDVTVRHDREEAIRRQRDELDTLNRISETVYEVIQVVVDAATREEIETVVSERLAASELYRSVWVGRNDPGETVDPYTGVGTVDDFLDRIGGLNDVDWTRHAAKAIETGTVQVIQRISDSELPESVREVAIDMGIESGTAVPVVHRGNVLGVICVYSSRPDAFSDREQAAFRRLGEVIGFCINAVQTERLLLSNTVTELTVRITGSDAFLASASSLSDGPARHEWSTPVSSDPGHYRHYITVAGIDPTAVIDLAAETSPVQSIEHVGENDDGYVFEVVTSDSLLRRLFEAGASPKTMVASDGETTLVVELPGDADTRSVVEAASELYNAELISKRKVERPVSTTNEFYDAVAGELTDRQKAALRHAYFGGYFSWPRDATAEEVAESMEISSPTFHYHIRRAQRTLVEAYLQHLED